MKEIDEKRILNMLQDDGNTGDLSEDTMLYQIFLWKFQEKLTKKYSIPKEELSEMQRELMVEVVKELEDNEE